MSHGIIFTLEGFDADGLALDPKSTTVFSGHPNLLVPPSTQVPTLVGTYSTNTKSNAGYNTGYITMNFTSNPPYAGTGNTTLVTVAHGFSFVPISFVKYDIQHQTTSPSDIAPNGAGGVLPFSATAASVGDNIFVFDSWCDATNLYIMVHMVDSFSSLVGLKIGFKYYIMARRGA